MKCNGSKRITYLVKLLTEQLCLYIVTGVPCVTPPGVENGYWIGEQTLAYGDSVTFECLPGFWFSPGVFSFPVTCDETGSWQPQVPKCKGSTYMHILIRCHIE